MFDWRTQTADSMAQRVAGDELAGLAFRSALALLQGEEIPDGDKERITRYVTAELGTPPESTEASDFLANRVGAAVAVLVSMGEVGPAFLALSKYLAAGRRQETWTFDVDGDVDGGGGAPRPDEQEALSVLGFTYSLAASPERQRDFWASVQALRDGVSDADATGAAEEDDDGEITPEQEGERVLAASILVNTCAVDPSAYLVFRCAVTLAEGEAVSDEDHVALARVLSDTWGEGWRDHERIRAEAAELAHEAREEIPEMVAAYLAFGEPKLAILHMVLYLDRVKARSANGGTE